MLVSKKNVMAVFAVATLALSGCGTENTETANSSSNMSSVSKALAPLEARVSLAQYGSPCDREKCYLPTQFQPRLVKGESVSLKEDLPIRGWPEDNDVVRVTCAVVGETLRNAEATTSDKWYGVVVPYDKASTSAASRAVRVGGGYLGYVSALWLDGPATAAQPCPKAQ